MNAEPHVLVIDDEPQILRALRTILTEKKFRVTTASRGEEGLALAAAQPPDVVILDEASSRLDPATERLVHTALGRLLAGRTGVIVAHRLATVAYADDILVLEDGQVLEHGPRLALAADPASRFAGLLRVATEGVSS